MINKRINKLFNPWIMPEWMERYLPYIQNIGHNSIGDLMNCSPHANEHVKSMLVFAAETQVRLLCELKANGLLR